MQGPHFAGLRMNPAVYTEREKPSDVLFAYGNWRLKALEDRYTPEFAKLAGVDVTFESIMKQQAHILTPTDQTYVMRDSFETLGMFFKRILKLASDPAALKQHNEETDQAVRQIMTD